jgi:XTP/dITP diphosphohydrolase
MQPLCFATQNAHKAREVSELLEGHFSVLPLTALGEVGDIPETGHTFADNALEKARFIHERFGVNCFADDSGLVVDALGGEPGVYSARYAGPQRSDADNRQLLLENMTGYSQRSARFVCVIALIYNGIPYLFEGAVEGHIASTAHGDGGFGYDPVFIPEGHTITFAQMEAEEKNAISHRARALAHMKTFLLSL